MNELLDLHVDAIRTGHGWTRHLSIAPQTPDGHVLFLHGLGARADRWLHTLHVASSLAFAAHAVDLPGHGFADRDATHRFDMDAMISFVVDVLDQLSHEPIVLVGTSFGGLIACHTAHRHPERVRALVAVGPVGIAPFTETATAALAASTTNSSLDAAEAKLRRVLYRRELIDAAWIAEEHAFAARSADGDGLAGLRTYLHPPDRVNSDVVTGWLDDLGTTMPTLVICGEQDRIVDVAAIEAAVSAMPHVRYAAVPEAGHLPYVERPEQFDAILSDFLSDVLADQGAG